MRRRPCSPPRWPSRRPERPWRSPSCSSANPTPRAARAELSATAFVDSIGVVTHLPYADTAYGRRRTSWPACKSSACATSGTPRRLDGAAADGLREVSAAGIDGTLGADISVDPARWVPDALAVMGDRVAAFEAPNEVDNADDPDWPAKLRDYMTRLAAAIRARRLASR